MVTTMVCQQRDFICICLSVGKQCKYLLTPQGKSGSRQNSCHLLMVLKHKQNSSWAPKGKSCFKKKSTWVEEDLKDRVGQSHFMLFGQSKNIYYGKSEK